MTIRQILNIATKKLSKTSNSASLDSEVLLSHVLGQPKEFLLANPNKEIGPKLEKQFFIWLSRRLSGWPVAYLTNQKEFLGLKLYVDKNVLIPRPETEGLVELILSNLKPLPSSLRVLDIGTGSGAIIISLAKSLSHNRRDKLFASDISAKALKIAKLNAKRNSVAITFKQGSLLKPWKNQSFDIIVANLPYLAKETDASTEFEPKRALVAKNQGLAIYEQLFKQLSTLSPLPSTLFLEIGHDQGPKIKNLAKKYLPGYLLQISKDLTGRYRYAYLSRSAAFRTARARTHVSV